MKGRRTHPEVKYVARQPGRSTKALLVRLKIYHAATDCTSDGLSSLYESRVCEGEFESNGIIR